MRDNEGPETTKTMGKRGDTGGKERMVGEERKGPQRLQKLWGPVEILKREREHWKTVRDSEELERLQRLWRPREILEGEREQ